MACKTTVTLGGSLAAARATLLPSVADITSRESNTRVCQARDEGSPPRATFQTQDSTNAAIFIVHRRQESDSWGHRQQSSRTNRQCDLMWLLGSLKALSASLRSLLLALNILISTFPAGIM